jgi:hypothetical protein
VTHLGGSNSVLLEFETDKSSYQAVPVQNRMTKCPGKKALTREKQKESSRRLKA